MPLTYYLGYTVGECCGVIALSYYTVFNYIVVVAFRMDTKNISIKKIYKNHNVSISLIYRPHSVRASAMVLKFGKDFKFFLIIYCGVCSIGTQVVVW